MTYENITYLKSTTVFLDLYECVGGFIKVPVEKF